MHTAIIGLMMMLGAGQVSPQWWRLSDSVDFHWSQVSRSGDKQTALRLQQAALLAKLHACDLAIRRLQSVEKRLGAEGGDAWVDVGGVYFWCKHWRKAYLAVRRSGRPASQWPDWAKVGAGLSSLADGRPWEALRIWKGMVLRSPKTGANRILAALAAVETGNPGEALTLLAPIPVTEASGGERDLVILGWLLRGLAFLVDGRSNRARSVFRAVIRSVPRLDDLDTEALLFVGCFDTALVATLLEQAMGCPRTARLKARAAAYRKGWQGGVIAGGFRASRTDTSAARPVRGRGPRGRRPGALRCAGFAPAIEAAATWQTDPRGQDRCRLFEKRWEKWTHRGP